MSKTSNEYHMNFLKPKNPTFLITMETKPKHYSVTLRNCVKSLRNINHTSILSPIY